MPCLLSSMTRKFLMNPSSLRISAMRNLSFDDGMSTFSCSARLALRMRVRKSAIGSLSMGLPARLDHAGHLALERELAEADPAGLELPQIAPRPATDLAAGVGARLELGRALLLHDERGLRHLRLPEGHAQVGEERLRFLVCPGGGHHRDVHSAHLVDLVVHDLGKDDLLLEAHIVVASSVEALGRDALEVPHPGQ